MEKYPLRFDVPVPNEERIKKTIQLGKEILKNSKIGGFDMKIPCDLILDLLPMYQNNLCSEATEAYITEHLTTCDKCYHILNEMDAEIDIPQYEVNAAIAKVLHPVEAARNSQNIFIASASHELRSPLAAIQSCAEIMEASPERDSILQECKRMTGLIQAMLSLEACDAGIWQMDFQETDIDMLLFETWETFSEKASKKDIRLNLDVEKSYLSIRCDKGQITQALGIILDNAISYSPSNTSIELGARVDAKQLVLSVTDHGQGIPDFEKEKVFQRFYSGDPSRTDKSHYGLGLSIAQEIVKQHCGTICLKDTGNGGCTFELVLPLP